MLLTRCAYTAQVTAVLGDWIGALTLTGSAVAFGKLHGVMSSSALTLPGVKGVEGVGEGSFTQPHTPAGKLDHPTPQIPAGRKPKPHTLRPKPCRQESAKHWHGRRQCLCRLSLPYHQQPRGVKGGEEVWGLWDIMTATPSYSSSGSAAPRYGGCVESEGYESRDPV